MDNNKKIILNSVYIYVGVLASTLLSLISVPILLSNLGASDYGLYNLVAGLITMLSFLKSSMIVTVQRFMNVAYGANDITRVNKVFTVSLLLYIAVAILTVVIVELLGPFITNGYLNIEENRLNTAVLLFQVLVFSTFFTTISIPYDALFNVYEDLGFFSIFNVLEAILRLLLAVVLGYWATGDKLKIFAVGLVIIAVLIFILKFVCCKIKYKEIKTVRINTNDISIVKDIFSFIGWNLYGTLARLFSNQGYAVVLNLFSGTTINAAYGIANQVNSCLSNITSSVEKAFYPQIMKSEGKNDRTRVLKMSLLSTKYCSLIYSILAVPLLITVPFVLEVWLKVVPIHTIAFTRIIIVASMISMLCTGITSIFYAVGEIRSYLLWLGSLLICVVFVAYGLMKLGWSVEMVVGLFILLEVVLMIVRLYFAKKIAGLNISEYLRVVLAPYLKVVIPTFIVVAFLPCKGYLSFVSICILSVTLYTALLYKFGFDSNEKERFKSIIKSAKSKINIL